MVAGLAVLYPFTYAIPGDTSSSNLVASVVELYFTVKSFECVWLGGANDSSFDVALLHHKATGWTYAATGFVPGNSAICRRTVDQAIEADVKSGEHGAYKRISLDTFVDGDALEGVIIEVTTGAAGTIQTMDLHISGVSEELTE